MYNISGKTKNKTRAGGDLANVIHHSARSPISYPEPSKFLRRMLDENEGSGKDQFLGDLDWLQ